MLSDLKNKNPLNTIFFMGEKNRFMSFETVCLPNTPNAARSLTGHTFYCVHIGANNFLKTGKYVGGYWLKKQIVFYHQ